MQILLNVLLPNGVKYLTWVNSRFVNNVLSSNLIENKVKCEHDNMKSVNIPQMSEVEDSVRSFKKWKAPRWDGFTADIFKSCWPIFLRAI